MTISGLSGPAPISVSGGEYRINDGLFTSRPGSVRNGDVLAASHVSANTPDTVTTTTLTINGVSDTFSSTTAADDINCGGGGTVDDILGRPLVFATSEGTLTNLRRLDDGPDTAPAGLSYPFGFFAFEITDVAPGATATVTITLPAGETADSVVKCIDLNCAPYAGATIDGNLVTLTLTDGGAGDADGAADGTIVDPVAPATIAVTPDNNSGGGASSPLLLLALLLTSLWRRRAGLSASRCATRRSPRTQAVPTTTPDLLNGTDRP